MFNIVVLSSSGGGNFLNLVNHASQVGYRVTKLITDRQCGAIGKAQASNIPWCMIDRKDPMFHQKILLNIPEDTTLIASCGYLSVIKDPLLSCWKGKIINSHPSLLPQYGGKGMYGLKVHEAVMSAKEEYTGCTIHYVESGVDSGEIILQRRVRINYDWTPWELGYHVYLAEEKLYIEAIEKLMMEQGEPFCE